VIDGEQVILDIEIRPYKENDFDHVTQLWRRSREISLPEFQRKKGYPFEMDQAYFKDSVLKKNSVWVAETNSKPSGFLAICRDFIDLLYVDPDNWNQGVGKALLSHARSSSPNHLWLFTLQVNHKARTFYQKNGFAAKKFGISPPPELEPDVEYHWFPS
jgi:GNAT superfamily N-acetyltransferase